MRRPFLYAAAAVAISLSFSQPGAAADRAAALFERLDTNHDGVVDRTEVQAFRNKIFDRIDANHDGYISSDEAEAARQRWRQRAEAAGRKLPESTGESTGTGAWIAKLDKDGDQRVSRAEFAAAGGDRLFQRFDRNHDGVISRDEMTGANGAPAVQ